MSRLFSSSISLAGLLENCSQPTSYWGSLMCFRGLLSNSNRCLTRGRLESSSSDLRLVEVVRRAGDTSAAGVSQNVGVDHGRLDVLVS